ncbi:MAG: Cna B-type domain-containing protein, partial [Clostridia bacterium]|nr:Cna B-type domain-containing protein [Clostridia bacterium]
GDTIWTHTVNKPTESSDTWDYTIDSLPMYINGKLVSYSVKETLPTGYKTEAATAAKAYEGETGHVDELNFINELDTFSLTITKTWDDFSNTYNTRPNDLALTIYANAAPLHPQPVLSWQKDNVKGVWTLTANGLPRYHQDGSLYRYSVKESSLEKYDSFGSTSDDSDGRFVVTLVTDVEGEAAFTNKLKRVSLSGIKTWEDKDNYYGYRPDKLELTVLADGDPLKGMPLANDGAFTVDKQAGNLWTYSIDNLPMYAAGDEPIQYAIQETMPAGYEALANGLAENLIREDAVLTGADLINTLAVISVSGKKTWLDNGNKYVTRPDLYDIRLLVCDGDGVPLPKQPPAEDIEWTDNADNTWSYIIYNLPRYQKGFMTEVMYRVIETADADGDYLPLYENTAKRAADGTIYDMNITNVLRPIVAIYNVTDGIAANGNKVGGYVSAGYGNPVKHNFDEGTGECLYVSWKPETNWVASPAVSLTYWLLDSDTPVTVAITPNDISALTNGDFPSARCHTDANGIITLTFANHVLDMPRRVEVDVSFLPTIAVINTTPQQTGGQVHVENGVWNSNHDGIGNRYVEKTVHGKANDNFVVDLTQITVQSASGGFPAVKLNLSANGSFKTQFITNLGGVNQVVPVEGRVLVNKRNANGQPIDITIMLDKLPCPVDLGILFLSVPPVILPTPTPTPTPVLTPTPTPTPRPSFTPTPTPTPTPTHTPPPLPSMPPDERAFDTVWILDDGSVPLGVGILMTLGDCFD